MEAATHLSLVDPSTGELADYPTLEAQRVQIENLKQQLAEAEVDLRSKRSQNTRLKSQLAEALGVEPEAEQVVEVLVFWRPLCMPGATIVVGSERWLKTRARLREKDITTGTRRSVAHLKAAVLGAKLSEYHVQNDYLDAVTIFRDSSTVDKHIKRAVGFKRTYGESALEIVDVLAGEGLRWLAERCNCGAMWIEHLYGGPAPGGLQPCERTGCAHFDNFYAKVDRFIREAG